MDREEKRLTEMLGRQTPFRVPSGYFDDLPSRVMRQLPEGADTAPEQAAATPETVVGGGRRARTAALRPTLWRRRRPAVVAAASVCVAVFSLEVYLHGGGGKPSAQGSAAPEAPAQASYSAMDAMADYAMLDTEDLYKYMVDTD